MKALLFLNGFYDFDAPEFYRRAIDRANKNGDEIICADGGIQIFEKLNLTPTVLIGDLDSIPEPLAIVEKYRSRGTEIVEGWIGKIDKDFTDGSLAIRHAIEKFGANEIQIYGGFPKTSHREIDHFMGNLKLMQFGCRLSKIEKTENYRAELVDRFQSVHFVISDLTLSRKSQGLERVSVIAELPGAEVAKSKNLRWDLSGMTIDPTEPNALRNELVDGANEATIRLNSGSKFIYVIHSWEA